MEDAQEKCSCKILQEGVLFSCIPARSCKIPAKSHKILQDPAGSCKILQGCKKKGPFLVRSCKSIFTGQVFSNPVTNGFLFFSFGVV